jgi:hypothetical protein
VLGAWRDGEVICGRWVTPSVSGWPFWDPMYMTESRSCRRHPRRGCQCGSPAERWLTAYLTQGATGCVQPDERTRADTGCRTSCSRAWPFAGHRHTRPRFTGQPPSMGWKTPSYTVAREIIAGLDRGLLALAHHDGYVYRDTYELVLRRESGHPNDLWQADTWQAPRYVVGFHGLRWRNPWAGPDLRSYQPPA